MADPQTGAQGDLVVGSAEITRLTSSIDEVVGELQTNRNHLSGVAGDVLAGWQGEASRQFSQGTTDAGLNLDRLIRALQNLRDLVQMSRDSFTAEEQEQAAQMRSVALNDNIASL
ncbi:WXG100 family type VII secretion target [Streptomyces hoynatensis]|uniref:WXG100 family type VII secretion target n=1 Tax=Streptomyces hoynatensis TaxID=1141874 RepID=A0A3A9YRJ1_9ACTN|nr:WXG100 family type VII secretion target [Streptomyces hoynatensis]RKN38721.1 hypothetical protein D7294_23085 [Streptomyces hoynatensis]